MASSRTWLQSRRRAADDPFVTMTTAESEVAEARGPGGAPAGSARVRRYDFSVSEALERNELRALKTLAETFARRAGRLLSGRLRLAVRLESRGLDQRAWADISGRLEDPAHVCLLSMAPLPGRMVVHVPVQLAMALVDVLMGGSGTGMPHSRPLSEIDQGIVTRVVAEAFGDLGAAIGGSSTLNVHSAGELASALLVPMPSEVLTVVAMPFTVEIAGGRPQTMTACIPFPMVRLILPLLAAEPAEDSPGTLAETVAARLLDVPLEGAVRFGSLRLRSAEVSALRPGDVIPLGHETDRPLDMVVHGRRWALVTPGVQGRKLRCTVVARTEEVAR